MACRLADRVQVGEQLATVAEPGQGVRRGLDAAGSDHPQVLLEDQRHPPDHRHHTGRGQHEREHVHLVKGGIDQHGQPDRAEGGREDKRTPGLNPDTRDRPRLPDGDRHDRRAEHPGHVDDPAGVGLVGDLEEVRRVPDRQEQVADQQERPATAEPPARHRQAADQDRTEREIADRIRKVGGNRER